MTAETETLRWMGLRQCEINRTERVSEGSAKSMALQHTPDADGGYSTDTQRVYLTVLSSNEFIGVYHKRIE